MSHWLGGRLWSEKRFLFGLVALGFAIRLTAALLTYGTEDVDSWNIVGQELLQGRNPYVSTHFVRWPPLWVVVIFVVKHASVVLQLDFVKLIKLPPILADVAIAVVVYQIVKHRLADLGRARLYGILYAVNPVSVLIVAVHGQFDAIALLFLVTSLYLFQRCSEPLDVTLAALALSLAILTKTWPLLLLPFFVIDLGRRKYRVIFVSTALLPVLVAMSTLYALAPLHVTHKVLRYSGLPGWWGFTSFHNVIQHPLTRTLVEVYTSVGGVVLLLGMSMLYLYYYRRRQVQNLDLLESLVGGILLMYLLASGYGTQYLSWIVPFCLIYLPENRHARYYLLLISVELLIEYLLRPYTGHVGEWVFKSPALRSERFYGAYGREFDIRLTNLLRWPLWLYGGLFLTSILARWRRPPTAEPSYGP